MHEMKSICQEILCAFIIILPEVKKYNSDTLLDLVTSLLSVFLLILNAACRRVSCFQY
jgi:hypothetical protein